MEKYKVMKEPLAEVDSCSEDSVFSSEELSQLAALDSTHESTDAKARRFSERPAFQYAVGAVIVLNTVTIALEAALVQEYEMKPFFGLVEFIFMVVYVAEITIRIRELGVPGFFSGPDYGWNWFDFTITASGVADAILTAVGVAGVGASAARLFRVLRIMRLFRAFRFLSEIDYVIFTAGRALLKLAMLVFLVVFVAGVVTTNILWDVPAEDVSSMYSNLGTSMWTMFKLMTLENWIGTVERTAHAKPDTLAFFVCFIFVASIAIMSLVPAIFIELNLSDRQKSEEQRIRKQREDTYKAKENVVRKFLNLVNRDQSGQVSAAKMSSLLRHGSRLCELQAADRATEGDMRDIKLGLFDLWESKLEEHSEGDVKLAEAEFLSGVLQSWEVIDEKMLWRSITSARRQLRELTALTKRQQAMLDRQQMQLDLLLQLHGVPGAPETPGAPGAPGPAASDGFNTARLSSARLIQSESATTASGSGHSSLGERTNTCEFWSCGQCAPEHCWISVRCVGWRL